MSEELNFVAGADDEPRKGDVLVQYNNDDEYRTAYDNIKSELDKAVAFASESMDWKEIRKQLMDVRDKIKGLFLKEDDNNNLNESIRATLESVNQRQTEEQDKLDKESQENFDSVIGQVNEACDFSETSSDFKKSRELLLAAQNSFKSIRLKRSHRDELYRLINSAFDNVSKKQNEDRENYEMECIENYHNLKGKIDAAIDVATKSENFAEARKVLINVQGHIKGLKLKREQRDELYQTIRDAFDSVNQRQEAERSEFNKATTENYDKVRKVVDDAINFAKTSEEYSISREQLINAQNQIKALKLRRDQRDQLFSDIRAVFEELNEKQSSERIEYESECNENFDRLNLKVAEGMNLVEDSSEFNIIRETLITIQGEVRIARLKKDQRNELFGKIREAFANFDKKKNDYYDQRKEDKSHKLHEIKANLEEKISRLEDVLSKDIESLEIQKDKLKEEGIDEFLISEINTKIENIQTRIKEKQESIDQSKARIAEIDLEISKF
ncbi:MAG: hypothetical protein KIT33_00050 [Candidatus Kapabacteria bacterium]|nr:hypothetical protein [Ignavibacteriota bacterium]MCW5883341.1 hypothetical protein [Candidatus Kapabacteria bacterium]